MINGHKTDMCTLMVILKKPLVLNTNTIIMVFSNFECIYKISNGLRNGYLGLGVLLLLFKQNYICFTTKRKAENILFRLCLERVCLCNIPVNSFGHIEMVS